MAPLILIIAAFGCAAWAGPKDFLKRDLPQAHTQAQRCQAYLTENAPLTETEFNDLRSRAVTADAIVTAEEKRRLADLNIQLSRLHSESAKIWNRDVPALHPYRIQMMHHGYVTIQKTSFFPPQSSAGSTSELVDTYFDGGLILDIQGPLNTHGWTYTHRGVQLDTGLFCMDGDGKFYLMPQGLNVPGQKNIHPYIQRGMPMAACGEIAVKNGKVAYLSNSTGHYQTSDELFEQAVTELERQGAFSPDARVLHAVSGRRFQLENGRWHAVF
jgi:hypothetical protein